MSIFNKIGSFFKRPQTSMGPDRELATDPNDYGALLLKGYELEELGNYEEALACYNRLLSIKPDAWKVWSLKADLLLKLGREEEALIWLERVLELEPERIDLLNNVSIVLWKLGRLEESRVYCEKILKIAPHHEYAGATKLRLDLIQSELKKQ